MTGPTVYSLVFAPHLPRNFSCNTFNNLADLIWPDAISSGLQILGRAFFVVVVSWVVASCSAEPLEMASSECISGCSFFRFPVPPGFAVLPIQQASSSLGG